VIEKAPAEIAALTCASLSATRSRIFYAQQELKREAALDPYLREYLEQA
jgi:DNA-directed RNA polymerase specialized sigma24 family protein